MTFINQLMLYFCTVVLYCIFFQVDTGQYATSGAEEVRSVLKQKLRQNLEERLDAEVDSILDELLGAQPEPSPELLPEPQAEDVTTENGDIQPESPVTDMTDTQPEPGTML